MFIGGQADEHAEGQQPNEEYEETWERHGSVHGVHVKEVLQVGRNGRKRVFDNTHACGGNGIGGSRAGWSRAQQHRQQKQSGDMRYFAFKQGLRI